MAALATSRYRLQHVYLWDLAARRWTGTLTGPSKGISSLAFGRHGILAVGADDHIYLWDVPARRLAGTIAPPIDVAQGNASIPKDGTPYPAPGAFDQNTTTAFSLDGTALAIDASFGYGTYLYNAATRNQVATLPLSRSRRPVPLRSRARVQPAISGPA